MWCETVRKSFGLEDFICVGSREGKVAFVEIHKYINAQQKDTCESGKGLMNVVFSLHPFYVIFHCLPVGVPTHL